MDHKRGHNRIQIQYEGARLDRKVQENVKHKPLKKSPNCASQMHRASGRPTLTPFKEGNKL